MASAGDALRALEDAAIPAIIDPDILATIGRDWTDTVVGEPAALVRPPSTDAVRAVLAAASRHAVPVTIQGGRTSLVAGAVPEFGAVALATDALRGVEELDLASMSVVVGAGTTLAELDAALEPYHLELGVDLASRDSATLGGMAATNAGGLRVLRYGAMARNVLGLELVTGAGRILGSVARPEKASGLDHVRLAIGTEGLLGVITRLRLRVVARPQTRVALVIGAARLEELVATLATLRPRLAPWLEAAEFFRGSDLEHSGLTPPRSEQWLALLQLASPIVDDEQPLEALPSDLDATVGVDAPTRERLWATREALPLATARLGIPLKLDVAVPIARLGELADSLVTLEHDPQIRAVLLFGHLAEGNCHVNIALEPGAHTEELTQQVFGIVTGLHGVIASEHGVGRTKRAWIRELLDEVEITALAATKRAFDPAWIVNRGVLLPEDAELP